MTTPDHRRRSGHPHFPHPHLAPHRNLTSDVRRLWHLIAWLALACVVVYVAMATSPVREVVDGIDRGWHRWMVELHATPGATVAAAFAAIGSVWVTVPLRIAVAGWLAWRRTWARLTVWLLAIALSEPAISLLKVAYDRERPPLSLEVTRSASFPSGHAVAGAVTAIALVAVLTQPTRKRWHWWGVAVTFTALMALSRTYLRAHWLSDVFAGTLLGATVGLLAVALVATYRPAHRPPRVARPSPRALSRRTGTEGGTDTRVGERTG